MSIVIQKYTEKSYVVTGDTTPFKEAIKLNGGKWNSNLKCSPFKGWIISNARLDAFCTLLNIDPSNVNHVVATVTTGVIYAPVVETKVAIPVAETKVATPVEVKSKISVKIKPVTII